MADGCDDNGAPPMRRGPKTSTITIEDFKFTPGDGKQAGRPIGGRPVDERGAGRVVG